MDWHKTLMGTEVSRAFASGQSVRAIGPFVQFKFVDHEQSSHGALRCPAQ
jgi:hypothetical protein